jgi:hypothetical protein
MAIRNLTFLAALIGAVGACESRVDEPPDHLVVGTPHMMQMPSGEDDICPMYVMNAAVAHEEVKGGAAMSFTAPAKALPDLRRRVVAMADHYRGHGMKGPPHMDDIPESTIRVEEHAKGARIVFEAKRLEKVLALRSHIRFHAERLDKGRCHMGDEPAEKRGM